MSVSLCLGRSLYVRASLNPLLAWPTALDLTLKSPVFGKEPAGAGQTAPAAQRPLALQQAGVQVHGKTHRDTYWKT